MIETGKLDWMQGSLMKDRRDRFIASGRRCVLDGQVQLVVQYLSDIRSIKTILCITPQRESLDIPVLEPGAQNVYSY